MLPVHAPTLHAPPRAHPGQRGRQHGVFVSQASVRGFFPSPAAVPLQGAPLLVLLDPRARCCVQRLQPRMRTCARTRLQRLPCQHTFSSQLTVLRLHFMDVYIAARRPQQPHAGCSGCVVGPHFVFMSENNILLWLSPDALVCPRHEPTRR